MGFRVTQIAQALPTFLTRFSDIHQRVLYSYRTEYFAFNPLKLMCTLRLEGKRLHCQDVAEMFE